MKVSPLDSSSLPSVGTSSALSQQQLEVLGAWYSLYCPDKEAQQVAALVKQYDEKANFEDNFVQVSISVQLAASSQQPTGESPVQTTVM